MKKVVLAVLLASTFVPALSFAQVYVRVAPPPPVVERYGAPPHAGYIWNPGYQRWNGARYIWVPGHWVRPPRPGAVWIPHAWVHRSGGWVLVEGHWR